MNQKQIIQMAKEADLWLTCDERIAAVERFAKLVEKHVLIEWAKEFAGLGEWACVNRIENEIKDAP